MHYYTLIQYLLQDKPSLLLSERERISVSKKNGCIKVSVFGVDKSHRLCQGNFISICNLKSGFAKFSLPVATEAKRTRLKDEFLKYHSLRKCEELLVDD